MNFTIIPCLDGPNDKLQLRAGCEGICFSMTTLVLPLHTISAQNGLTYVIVLSNLDSKSFN